RTLINATIANSTVVQVLYLPFVVCQVFHWTDFYTYVTSRAILMDSHAIHQLFFKSNRFNILRILLPRLSLEISQKF
ncbi:MAG: hypothetical protein FWC09_07465, partial [Lachnospiraceae bacterium]|nr:hypothetical protein [Lachnospiraceae bacterium]